MGREIRRVPPNWEHPRYEPGARHEWDGEYIPLYDKTFDEAITTWMQEASAWVAQVNAGETPKPWWPHGEEEEAWARANPFKAYSEWSGGPPDPESYRSAFTSEPTAYQIYETVTEGTPISPVIMTREALIEWCTQAHPSPIPREQPHGRNLWDAISREAAEAFAAAGSAPTLMVSNPPEGTPAIYSGAEAYEPGAPLGPRATGER